MSFVTPSNLDLAADKRFLRDGVHNVLRKWIFDQRLAWGQELIEVSLAEQLGVSRTPIREAIRRLESEGLVERSGAGGVRVRRFAAQDIREIYEVLIPLYATSARLAAQRFEASDADRFRELLEGDKPALSTPEELRGQYDAFHALVADVARNGWLIKTLGNLREYSSVFRHQLKVDEHRSSEGMTEHRRLYQLIHDGAGAEAAEAMTDHISAARDAILTILDQQVATDVTHEVQIPPFLSQGTP